jgi:PAS domain S-box-containing protein
MAPAASPADKRPAGQVDDPEALRRSLLDDSPLFFLALRHDATIAYASEAIERVLGTPASEYLNTSVLDMLHPDEVERATIVMSAVTEAGAVPGLARFRLRHADGSWTPAEVFAALVSDGTDEYLGVYVRSGFRQVLLEDILTLLLSGAARSEVLEPVLNAAQWYGSGSQLVISYWDGERFQQIAQPGFPDELGGAGEPGDSPWERCRRTAATVQGAARDLDPIRRASAERERLGWFWIEPVVWADDKPPATVTVWSSADSALTPIAHDYSMGVARYLTELILRWTQQSVELDRATRRLVSQEKLASLGTLTAGVAHEVRNPLSFIKNFAESATEFGTELVESLSSDDVDTEAVRQGVEDILGCLDLIEKHGTRIDSIVTNMLSYSKEQVGAKEMTDVGALVKTFVDLGYQGYRGSHPDFSASLLVNAPEGLEMLVHPQEIGRVLVNLVTNACDSMHKLGRHDVGREPRLNVDVERTGKRLSISVRDNGIGIAPEAREHLFEPFFTTKAPGEGTGLGLGLCHDIVVGLHDGEMLVDSKDGEGATFTVLLPIPESD